MNDPQSPRVLHNFRRSASAAAIALLASVAAAQSVTVPNAAGSREGNSRATAPFEWATFRYQLVVDRAVLGGQPLTIRSLRFRVDGDPARPRTGHRYADLRVSWATTRDPVEPRATVFYPSIGLTQVRSGPLQLPDHNGLPRTTFDVVIPLDTPIVWSGQENLVLDLTVPGPGSSQRFDYPLDAELAQGTVTSFGSAGRFSTGESPALAFGRILQAVPPLAPGGAITARCERLATSRPVWFMLGLSDTSFGGQALPWSLGPIGAPGNSLLVSPDLIRGPYNAIPLGRGYTAFYDEPLPADPSLNGLDLYLQAWSLDFAANALGAVTSNALHLTIGSGGAVRHSAIGWPNPISTGGMHVTPAAIVLSSQP